MTLTMTPAEEQTGPAYLVPAAADSGPHWAVYLLPHVPERRVGAIMSRLGGDVTVTARPISNGRLLWSLPGASGPANRTAAGLLCGPASRTPAVRGTALITGGSESWPEGLTVYQANLTTAELDAAELLVRQQTARLAAAAALQGVARDTGRSLEDVRRCLVSLCGCNPERATPAQLETVRTTLLRA